MKRIYIVLQFLISIYCAQSLYAWYRKDMGQLIGLICIHLILYLMSVVMTKISYKQWFLIADMIYIGIALMGGCNYDLLMILVLVATEFLTLDIDYIKKLIVLGGSLWISSMFWDLVMGNWLMYSVLIVLTLFIYFNEDRIRQLQGAKDTLMDQVSHLHKSLEVLKREKNQTAYITQISERNKLTQALHDKVGHLLAGNIMQLEAIKIILSQDEAKAIGCLEQVTESLREGLEEIRYTLKELKPAIGESGLSQVKVVLQSFKEQTGITPKLSYKGDLESIDLEKWHIISDNLKETVTNFVKYSNGDEFTVSIEVMNKLIKVRFKDNGYIEGSIKKSIGLRGIEERTLSIDGKLIVNTENGFETIMLIKR